MPLTEQEQVRRDHLAALREAGIEPYPAAEWRVSHHAADILATYDDEAHNPDVEGAEPVRVTIAGRMLTKRVMGKAAFFHLADESGTIQIYVRRDGLKPDPAVGESFYNDVFKRLLDPGDILGIEGFAFRTRMGEVTVEAERVVLLSKSLKPLPIEKARAGRHAGTRSTLPSPRGLSGFWTYLASASRA